MRITRSGGRGICCLPMSVWCTLVVVSGRGGVLIAGYTQSIHVSAERQCRVLGGECEGAVNATGRVT